MSYHYPQRWRDHLNPILEEGFRGEFGGKDRKKKLSGATLSIGSFVVMCLNEKGSWRVSLARIMKATGLSKSTISTGLKELVKYGYLTRHREAPRSAYEYRLGPRLDCPPNCEQYKNHNSDKDPASKLRSNYQTTNQDPEIPERSNEQTKERSNEQTSNGLTTRPLKEIKENKKKVTPCSFCRVEPESISGIDQNLHSDNCSELARIKRGRGWQIAISNYGEEEWIGLSSKDQQRAYYEDLTKGLARKQNKLEAIDLELQKRKEELERLIGEDEILPGWLFWLRKRIETQPIKEQEVESAKKYSRERNDLVPGRGDWEEGRYFTLEALQSSPVEIPN